ncbi:hypothetical protein PoB_007465100 [Plakobranchus ocellatus]|uniref:Uncharacterized protein n=1 Tax=Plakobranchus ocellatus TaxID=259542 RepID=A0AAV4DW57_9GAST|nr:hypothetical protein PoB_007465100 [Plakobranchus ocellatus]
MAQNSDNQGGIEDDLQTLTTQNAGEVGSIDGHVQSSTPHTGHEEINTDDRLTPTKSEDNDDVGLKADENFQSSTPPCVDKKDNIDYETQLPKPLCGDEEYGGELIFHPTSAQKGNKEDSLYDNSSDISHVSPGNSYFGTKEIIRQTRAKVEIVNKKCIPENPALSEKCNAAWEELSDFQREFLSIAPEGEPNILIFSELVLRDPSGNIETNIEFKPIKNHEPSIKERLGKKISNIFNKNNR